MYKRFLCDSDYLSLLTKEAFHQLIREEHDRLWQAEEVSEASILEYLHGKFEVEKALEIGRIIKEYNPQITYPSGAHFLLNDKPVRAIQTINGNKRPTEHTYWELVEDELEMMTPEEEDEQVKAIYDSFKIEELEDVFSGNKIHAGAFVPPLPHAHCDGISSSPKASRYSQRNDYLPGQYIKFANVFYKCLYQNGPSFNDIQIPGISCWEEIDTVEWATLTEYDLNDVVSYEGKFYALLSKVNYDKAVNPKKASDSVWGQIGEYNPKLKFEFSETEWVVFNGKVYVPTMDPNASVLEENVNYAYHDPRNINLKKHMLRMAVYELHKLIAPHNVSTARITDYEASLQWLQDASRLKIDPGIMRCIDHESRKPVSDYGIATFRRDYDPYQNEWQI